jgi:threonine dehydratase
MGSILCAYREAYRTTGDRTWGIAEDAIAAAVGCSTRTLRRLMDRYREAAKLPETVRGAMKVSGINPIKATSSKIVSNLVYMVGSNFNPDENEAAELVARAKAIDPRSNYVALTREQKLIWQDRVAIRRMLGRSNDSNRLRDLIRALEKNYWSGA